jgi:hypothetical protein
MNEYSISKLNDKVIFNYIGKFDDDEYDSASGSFSIGNYLKGISEFEKTGYCKIKGENNGILELKKSYTDSFNLIYSGKNSISIYGIENSSESFLESLLNDVLTDKKSLDLFSKIKNGYEVRFQ